MNKTPEEIVALVRNAGVVGAAGTGFPTYAKLQAKAGTVIINGSECEPLLHTDKTTLKDRALEVIEGLKLVMHATGASEGVVAVNESRMDVVNAVKKTISLAVNHSTKNIRIHLLGDYYPAGDEFLMVYDVTKKIIPEGGTPSQVGVTVLNVLTTLQIYQAVNGKPVTEKAVTVAGEVRDPKVLTVPLGTSYSELIRLAGGSTLKEYAVLDGGPMMGCLISNLSDGIGKTTAGIVVLPLDHGAITMKSKTTTQVARQSKAVADYNGRSTDLCPRHLLGHHIDPHLTMRATDYNLSEPSHHITSAFLCSGCGVCEINGDATFLSPKKIFGEYQRLLAKAGVENPHRRTELTVHSQYENRKMSTALLVKKLDIARYSKALSSEGLKEIPRVRIPTQKHLGAPSQAMVKIGQLVRRGDVIALSPPEQLGSVYHASIHGKISAVTEQWVEITGLPS